MADYSLYEEEENLGKAYDGRLMRRFLGYLRPHWKLISLCLGIIFIGMAAEIAAPIVLWHAIDGPIAAGDEAGLWMLGGLFFAFVAVASFLDFAETYWSNKAGQRIIYDLRTQTFDRLQRLPVSYYDRNPVGRLLVRVTNDVENLSELFTSGLITLVSDVLLIVGITVTMFFIDWRLSLFVLASLPLVFVAMYIFRKFARPTYRDSRKAIASLNAFLNESVGGVKTIQIFNRQESCFDKFEERNREYRDKSKKAVLVYSFFWPVIAIISAVGIAGILLYAGWAIPKGLTTFGAFISFWVCVEKLFRPLQELAEKYNILQSAMASSERIFKLIDTPAEIAAPEKPKSPKPAGSIAFENVTFSYDGRTTVLDDVSFSIRPGEKIAVVGYTGGGKTTLVNLLLRLYEAGSGRVVVDGEDVRNYDPRELRRRFGLVLQDVFLFSGSVEDNLRLGEEIPDEAIERALKTVNADKIVDRLPDGWKTRLRERGSSLSTGERQLLSFARALVFDPPVLVLDEATSSVDAETEGLIQEAMDRMLKNRTALIVAHRLSTVRRADRILVVHRGKIREQGTHEELVQRGGLYEKLYRLQWQPAGA